MKKKRIIVWGIIAAGIIAILPPAYHCAKIWLHDRQLVGLVDSYEYGEVLNDPIIHQRLTDFLGKELFGIVRGNLETIVPVKQEGDFIVLQGLKAHKGGEEEALLWIERPLAGHRIIALVMRNRYIHVYLPEGMTKAADAPEAFIDALRQMNYNNYQVKFHAGDRRREDDPMPDDHLH